MASGNKISTYGQDTGPATNDTLLGDQVSGGPTTKRFPISSLISLFFNNIPNNTSMAPFASNPYKFSAYWNSPPTNFLGTSSTEYILTYDTKLFDTSSDYNASTGIYTCPVAGFYYFYVTVAVLCYASEIFGVRIRSSPSVEYAIGQFMCGSAGNEVISGPLFALIQCAANTEIYTTVSASTNNTGLQGGEGYCTFGGFLVSAS